MKLQRVRAGRYEGRLEPYQVVASRDEDTPRFWTGCLMSGEQRLSTVHDHNLKGLKRLLVLKWVRLRMQAVYEAVPNKDATFVELYQSCLPRQSVWDPLNLFALRDYLEERGVPHFEDVIRDGQAAGVTWPDGWGNLWSYT